MQKPVKLIRVLSVSLMISGALTLFFVLLAFTHLPYWMYHGLGSANSSFRFKPHAIVLLGGGGMPSEQNLQRVYYASFLHKQHPEIPLYVCLPLDTAELWQESALFALRKELMLRGVDSTKIILEKKGVNTRDQALELKMMIGKNEKALLIVTSPEHMYRAVASFRAVGFKWVGGVAAFEHALNADFTIKNERVGGKNQNRWLTGWGNNPQYRYQFWNHLKYEVICMREYTALLYYWVRGWI